MLNNITKHNLSKYMNTLICVNLFTKVNIFTRKTETWLCNGQGLIKLCQNLRIYQGNTCFQGFLYYYDSYQVKIKKKTHKP